MFNLKQCQRVLLVILSLFASLTYATNTNIEFIFSNNSQSISLETAYARIHSNIQDELTQGAIQILQTQRMEEGTLVNVLGTYQMTSDKKVTADNTEIFYASPLQHIANEEAFSLATLLATHFKQESVAVFIPLKQSKIGEVSITFKSSKPKIPTVIDLIKRTLPASYSTAFTLHLADRDKNYTNATVTKIEWLGSNIDFKLIKQAFPLESVTALPGQAFLVYKNGQVDLL